MRIARRASGVEEHDQGAVAEEAVGFAAIGGRCFWASMKMVFLKQHVGSLLSYPCRLLSGTRWSCVLLCRGFSVVVNLEAYCTRTLLPFGQVFLCICQ